MSVEKNCVDALPPEKIEDAQTRFKQYVKDIEPGMREQAPHLKRDEAYAVIAFSLFVAWEELKAELEDRIASVDETAVEAVGEHFMGAGARKQFDELMGENAALRERLAAHADAQMVLTERQRMDLLLVADDMSVSGDGRLAGSLRSLLAAHTGQLKPKMACRECACLRSDDTCWKCGNETFKPAAGWTDPELPPVARIRELAAQIGYAIGVHGSQERDLDLIAAPWTEEALKLNYREVMQHIADGLSARLVETELKPLGRRACTIQMNGWFKPIDLSVCPMLVQHPAPRSEVADTDRLNWLRDETCDLRCIDVPTGAGDCEVRWVVVRHHMSKPHEREIGRSTTEEPREAIDAARAGDAS